MSVADKEESIAKWNKWKNSMTDQAYVDIIYGGKLNRTKVAQGCGLTPKTVRGKLRELEDELRARNVLPRLTEKGDKELKEPKSLQKEAMKTARQESRVPALEQQIIELKAEISALTGKYGRFSELHDTFTDLGDL
jgi:predicted transcriptional regulator